MTKEKIKRFAQSSIYDNAEYIGKWKGYEVYEPGFVMINLGSSASRNLFLSQETQSVGAKIGKRAGR